LLLIGVGSLLVACSDDEGSTESSGGTAARSGGNGGAMATGGTTAFGGSGGTSSDSGGAGGTSSGGNAPSSGGGPGGDTCGGIIGAACPTGMYCAYPRNAMCGAADQLGTCQSRPEMCTMEFLPVCGCDDNTYSNACAAASAGVSVASDGACS
jgi:hypothetical protein